MTVLPSPARTGIRPPRMSASPAPAAASSPKLLPTVRRALKLRHYCRRTEEAYVGWIRRFVRSHGLRHPAELGEADISAFLSELAAEAGVSASTQTQALSAGGWRNVEFGCAGIPLQLNRKVVRQPRSVSRATHPATVGDIPDYD